MRLLPLFSHSYLRQGKIPIIGPMKKAYRMMKEKGIQMGDIKGSDEEADADEEEDFDENNERTKHVSVLNLILPLVCIVIALLATGLNCLRRLQLQLFLPDFYMLCRAYRRFPSMCSVSWTVLSTWLTW